MQDKTCQEEISEIVAVNLLDLELQMSNYGSVFYQDQNSNQSMPQLDFIQIFVGVGHKWR